MLKNVYFHTEKNAYFQIYLILDFTGTEMSETVHHNVSLPRNPFTPVCQIWHNPQQYLKMSIKIGQKDQNMHHFLSI